MRLFAPFLRSLPTIIFFGMTLWVVSLSAQPVIEITQGNIDPLPIAITDFTGQTSDERLLGKEIASIVTADLKRSGLFNPLPNTGFIEDPHGMGPTPRFADWRLTKAQALATGAVQKQGDQLRVEFRLWDVYAQKQIEGVAFTGHERDLRRLAHKVSNAIYKRLIGDEGYFDTQVVYIWESAPNRKQNIRKLALMDQDGANHQFLSDGKNLVITPRFSPVGPEITYMAFQGQKKSLEAKVFMMNLVTGSKHPLGNFKGMTYSPRFTPDGRKVIFSQTHKGGTSSLYEMDPHSRQLMQITNSMGIDTSPCHSPDGRQIVFNSDRGGSRQLYVMNQDGSQVERISFGEGIYATPVWSPRGDLIAFTKLHKGRFYIGVMRPDGSGERLLTEGFVLEGPTWAPNGRLILYTRITPSDRTGKGSTSKLYAIDLTGKIEFILPTPGNASDGAWSPLDYR